MHWAHQVASQFPDGQLYVNLRGNGPSGAPVTPAEAIREFLDALAVPAERIPAGTDAQAGLYRSLLAGRKMLILLDNARDATQVRPLLPGTAGCLVLVTSRSRLTGLAALDAAKPLTVNLLSEHEARDLLSRRLGSQRVSAEPEAVAELITLSARLPLALNIAAARAAEPGHPLAALVADLRDERGRLDILETGEPGSSLRALFSWSYQNLSQPGAWMFRLLSLNPGPDITAAAAASLAAHTPARARAQISELADANLISEYGPGRYAFHDLLRAYAADLASRTDSEETRRQAVHRVLDHYLHTACAGSRLLNPVRPHLPVEPPRPGVTPETLNSVSEALAWFAAERQVLLAAIALADQAGFGSYAWQLPWAMWLLFDRAGDWHDQVAIQRTAVAAAQRLGDLSGQAHACRDLGAAYGRLGLLTDAREYCRQALELHRQAGDRLGKARAHNEIMLLAEQQGRLAEALGHAQRSLDLYREEGDEPGQARMLNGVGWMHAKLGDYKQALEYCGQALSLYQEGHGDPLNQAATWDSVGYVLFHLGRLDEVIGCLRTALRTIEGFRPGYYQTTMLVHLGDAYHAIGEPGLASQAWKDALAILEALEHSDADQVRARLRGEVPLPGSIPVTTARLKDRRD